MRGFRFRNGSSFSKGVFVFVRVFVFVMDLRFRKGLRVFVFGVFVFESNDDSCCCDSYCSAQLAPPSTTASLMLLSIFKVFANLRKIRVALGKLRC